MVVALPLGTLSPAPSRTRAAKWCGQAIRDIRFDFDEIGIDTEDGGGADASEHPRGYV
jgi:hypothetical protein